MTIKILRLSSPFNPSRMVFSLVIVENVFVLKAGLVLAVPTLAAHFRQPNVRFPVPPKPAGCIRRSERQSLLRFRLSNVPRMMAELTGLPQKPTRHLSGGKKTGCHVTPSINWLWCDQSAPNPYITPPNSVTFNPQLLLTCSFTQTQPRNHTLTIGLLCC